MYEEILGLIIVASLGLLSIKRAWVDVPGFLAGLFVGCSILILGGLRAYLLIMSFYVLGSLATRLKYKEKARRGSAQPKGGARGWRNVLAHGLIPVISLGIWRIDGSERLLFAYLAAISSSLADTLSNEIGILNPTNPRLITRPWKRVPPGISGGVSPLGLSVAFLSPFLLGLITRAVGFVHSSAISFATITGFLGSTIDSVIGAEVQALFRCEKCGKLTEKTVHCGVSSRLVKGHPLLNNHFVNFVMSSLSGVIGYFLSAAFL